jgi:hypothetical protein
MNNKMRKATIASISSFLIFSSIPLIAADSSRPSTSDAKIDVSLLQKLEAARSLDLQEAKDPNVSAVRHETFLNQMNKADRVIEELTHGVIPPHSEIDDALWMPPEHLTPEERSRLIEELKRARAQDEQNEQRMLNGLTWGNSAAPEDTAVFDEHKALIAGVIKNLEIGAPVHWTDIKNALATPRSSY